jgi:hypothetical protein
VRGGVSAVQKPNLSPRPNTPAPLVVPNIPCKVHPKPPCRSAVVGRESQPPSLLPPRTICDSENNTNKMSGAREVKAGAATATANNFGASTNDSNLYSIEGAIDGLLEVGGTGAHRSPKKQKKLTHTTADDEALAMLVEEAPSKVRSKVGDISRRASSIERKKLLIFNVQGTLLKCSLLIDKNPNAANQANN